MLTADADERVGRVLEDRYRLRALVGVGGSARVYLAEDLRLHRRVAVKVLHAGLAGDAAFLHRFRTEARAAAGLNHPHLLAVYDWGEDADGPFLVTEYLAGGSLRAILDRQGTLSVAQAVKIGIEAAAGLGAAHRAGMVHRDVKPGNVLFDLSGRVRIADFGLVQALSESALTEPDGIIGTARYLPPEAGGTETLDGRADVYALGLTLVEAVTGEVPAVGSDAAETVLRRRRGAAITLPEEFAAARRPLEATLRREPPSRPSATQLAKELIAVTPSFHAPAPIPVLGRGLDDGRIHVEPVSDPPQSTALPVARPEITPRRGRRRRRRTWIKGLVAVLVLAALAAGALVAANLVVGEDPIPTHPVIRFADGTLSELQAASLTNGWDLRTSRRIDADVPLDFVISTDPPPGTDLQEGGIITAVVSDGPPMVVLPVTDLVGLPEAEATARLSDLEFVVGGAPREQSEDVPADVVIRIESDGETVTEPVELVEGSTVFLVVSDGPTPRAVQEVVGRTVDEARTILESQQLALNEAEPQFSETVEAGRIISQDPPAAASLERGGAVTVVVSKGADRRTVPEFTGLTVSEAKAELEKVGLALGTVYGPADGRVFATDTGQEPGSRHPPGTAINVFVR